MSGTLVLHDNELDDTNKEIILRMAYLRSKLMTRPSILNFIIYCTKFRFAELNMFFYQWQHKLVDVCFENCEMKSNLILSQRVLRQFRDYFTQQLRFPLLVPSDHVENPKGDYESEDYMHRLCEALAIDIVVVLFAYHTNVGGSQPLFHLRTEDENAVDTFTYTLRDMGAWYQKLSFFMQTVVKTLHCKSQTVISVALQEPGSEDYDYETFQKVFILPTVVYKEIDVVDLNPSDMKEQHSERLRTIIVQNKLTRILSNCQFPPISNDFNADAVKHHLEDSWVMAMLDSTAVTYQAEDSSVIFKRHKRERQKLKNKSRR
jgi:hypothetical protein